jgi:hypothetical protein
MQEIVVVTYCVVLYAMVFVATVWLYMAFTPWFEPTAE